MQVLDNFESICTNLNIGLPAEIEARQKQYEYYRDLLLTFAETGSTLVTDRQTDRQTDELHMQELSSGERGNGVMGVPITFLDKYNPDQFIIIGLDRYVADNPRFGHRFTVNGKETYARILIKRRM